MFCNICAYCPDQLEDSDSASSVWSIQCSCHLPVKILTIIVSGYLPGVNFASYGLDASFDVASVVLSFSGACA